MRPSEIPIHDVYSKHPELWEAPWRAVAVRALARAARGFLVSMLPIEFDERISNLDEPATRAAVNQPEVDEAEIIEKLVEANGSFRRLAAALFSEGTVRMPSGGQLRSILHPLVQGSLASVRSSEILVSISFSEVYSELANLLSEELYQLGANGGDHDDRLVLNYALLIYHLRRWKTPFNALKRAMADLNEGALSVRGWLLSIQNRHPSFRVADWFFPPVKAFAAAQIPERIQELSKLLEVIQLESIEIVASNGFFHRALPVDATVEPKLLSESTHANQELVEAGRRLHYPQYEHTALLFMALAGIEFLLRSFCPALTEPDLSLETVIDGISDIDQSAKVRLSQIISTEEWNIRNRCMHGSFLEVEGRSEDLIRSSGMLMTFRVPPVDLSKDGSLPESVSALVLEALSELAHQLECSTTPCERAWTAHFLLSAAELQFAGRIYCDLLQPPPVSELWRKQIVSYLRTVAPVLSIPIQMGLWSWSLRGAQIDTIPGFYFLALLLEPLLRLTLHMAGHSVLQKGTTNKGGFPNYRVQYKMMDDTGLLDPSNVDWLTAHLSAQDKLNATEMLRLGVKCRDAVAHGAVWDFTDELRRVYGHTIVKAIQLIAEAGSRHLDANPSVRGPAVVPNV